jgi:hypothetical protein
MAKQIQPVSIWTASGVKSAEQISAIIINDNLSSSATFYYELKAADVTTQDGEGNDVVTPGASLQNGNCSMGGADYENWDDSNDAAYAFVAGAIGVTII